MAIRLLRIAAALACLQVLTACSYDSVRMNERSRCAAMPQSLGERCYQRNRDTRAEYDAKREALRESARKTGTTDKPDDPRYDQWLP